MIRKLILSAAVAGTAFAALPTAAQAQGRYGYYDGYAYQQSYRDGRYNQRYDQRRYDQRRYDRRVYNRGYQNHYGQRCSGTTGTILGAIAGGLLGRAIDGGRDRAAGTIIGAGAGALAGRAIDRENCRY